jgi:hypothetical protein
MGREPIRCYENSPVQVGQAAGMTGSKVTL